MDLIETHKREAIARLQAAMAELPQLDLEKHTKHFWANGMYLRTLFCPAGTAIVGKVHRQEHFFILAQGEMTIASEHGTERVAAPRVWVSAPGIKRCGWAHVDCLVINVHRTAERNLELLELELTEPDSTARFGPGNRPLVIEDNS